VKGEGGEAKDDGDEEVGNGRGRGEEGGKGRRGRG